MTATPTISTIASIVASWPLVAPTATHARLAPLVGAFFLTMLTPSASTAATPSPGPSSTQVAVNIGNLDEDATIRLRTKLHTSLDEALEQAGQRVVSGGGEARVTLSVTMTDADLRTYELSYTLALDGESRNVVEPSMCEACSEEAVVELALDLLPKVILQLALTPRGEDTSDLPEGESDQLTPEARLRPRQRDGSTELVFGPIGFSGAATVVGGFASLVGGTVLLGSKTGDPSVSLTTTTTDPRRSGAALLGVGITALALGGAALAVDLTVLSRLRRERRHRVSASITPTSVGLSVSGRF